jgi:hypothetical protein
MVNIANNYPLDANSSTCRGRSSRLSMAQHEPSISWLMASTFGFIPVGSFSWLPSSKCIGGEEKKYNANYSRRRDQRGTVHVLQGFINTTRRSLTAKGRKRNIVSKGSLIYVPSPKPSNELDLTVVSSTVGPTKGIFQAS